MHHHVQYVAAAPHQMHGRPAAVILQDDIMKVVLDREQIDGRLFGIMEVVAAEFVTTLTLRDTPTAEPWGKAHLPYVDADDPLVMTPRITPSGIVLPVPHLITVDLVRALESLTDDSMRMYDPPPTLT